MHLLRDTGTVLLAVGGATLSTMALHCRWTYDTMRVAYTDKSPLCAISAVALLAGHSKDWSQQCLVGRLSRLQVPVPREYVEALLPGIFSQGEQLQQQYQHTPNKASVNHSRISLVDTLVMLAEALLRVLPFRLQQHGSTYVLLQLPQVQAILASPSWPTFQQQVLDDHSKVEQQRQSPWATLAPHLAGRLDQLVDGMQHLTEAVNQQQSNVRPAAAQPVAAQQAAQQQAAPQQAAQPLPAAGPLTSNSIIRHAYANTLDLNSMTHDQLQAAARRMGHVNTDSLGRLYVWGALKTADAAASASAA